MLTFYQIAQFKNPYSHLYSVRKIVINDAGEIVHTFDKEYPREKIEEYIRTHQTIKYCMYPVYDLGLVGPPTDQIAHINSSLLNGLDEGTTEFHKF